MQRISNVTHTATVTCYSNRAIAKTELSASGGNLSAHVRIYYATPASPASYHHEDAQNNARNTSVSAVKSIDASLYTSKFAYGGHDVSYSGWNFAHLNTYDAV